MACAPQRGYFKNKSAYIRWLENSLGVLSERSILSFSSMFSESRSWSKVSVPISHTQKDNREMMCTSSCPTQLELEHADFRSNVPFSAHGPKVIMRMSVEGLIVDRCAIP
ncbi:hypothetical protein GOBAR_DD11822 [Gossypium barbadense]|nr:hypothetical protein GOBAR_DD11822 [Gossypium barbadense]